MIREVASDNCSRETLNVLAPKLVAYVGSMSPNVAIEALNGLAKHKHSEARCMAMQLETTWLSHRRQPDRVPFGGGLYCPMGQYSVNLDTLASLDPENTKKLHRALEAIQGAELLKHHLTRFL